jgi:CRISPR-associated protein Cmr5
MTRQQRWANEAFRRVLSRKGTDESKYRTLCMKMPVLLKQCGVVQALAFIRAREEMGDEFCDNLAEVYGARDGRELFATSMKAKLPQYLALSRDLIEVSVWFRRFAQSELEAEKAAPQRGLEPEKP